MRYSAFISYSFRDRRWATWLHRSLERYRVPRRLHGREGPGGPIGPRLPPVFRDRDELAAASDLAEAVRQALRDSDTLIVICSPSGAKSHWVNEEIRYFTELGRRDRIRCLIVDGEPHAQDPERECLPPALLEGGVEPLAADARRHQDGKAAALLKLIASMLAVPYDELRQREAQRRQRRLAIVAGASTAGFAITLGLAIFAMISRAEAVEQRNLAIQRTQTAERTVRFVKSMFETSDPSKALGETITARQILDTGARQIMNGLGEEPAVRAELAVTLSDVYGTLGLYGEAERMLNWSWGLRHGQPDLRARQYVALGDVHNYRGGYSAAIDAYRRAIALARRSRDLRGEVLPRALVGLGQAQSYAGDLEAAETSLGEASRLALALHGRNHPDVALALEARAMNLVEMGNLAEAEALVRPALAIRRSIEGEASPSVSDNLNTLGNIAYFRGDLAAAEDYYRSRLAVDERVLTPKHPDVGTTINNLARVMIERGEVAGAVPLLQRAVAITVPERGEGHDQMAFLFGNLGIAYRETGKFAEADVAFAKAIAAARRHRHRNLAPLLVDVADMRCRSGRVEDGLALVGEARPLMAETYRDDPWRVAWADAIRGSCLTRAGRRKEGAALLAAGAEAIRERWSPGTLFRDRFERALAAARA